MKDSKSSLQFTGYNILEFHFTMNPKAIAKNMREVGVGFNYSYKKKDDTHFSVILSCFINDKSKFQINKKDEDIPFKISSSMEGNFSLESPSEIYLPNAIAILFPYLRSFISTITAQSGMPPFILPTFNILALLEQKSETNEASRQNEAEKDPEKK